MTQNKYPSPYIPNTDAERQSMLDAIGVKSVNELFSDIPSGFGNELSTIPPALSELELQREMEWLSSLNINQKKSSSFIGGGAYNHFVPSAVRHITNIGELSTAYTPYQPEVSQGTLQITYEFQSLISQLMGMDVANAGMYDGATSTAEAALMACRIKGRNSICILNSVSPTQMEVIKTYTEPQGINIYTTSPENPQITEDTACLIVQHPNFYGYLEDMKNLRAISTKEDILMIVSTDPIFLGMFEAPGSLGADIAVADGQPLGIALNYGGPYVGLFTCKSEFLRQMPGRIVGKTVDTMGKEGYVLTLQTREQHIRRERATSNICTSEALICTAVVAYLACVGKTGLKHIAELTYHKAHYAASLISQIKGYSLPINGSFFKEFVVECPLPPKEVNDRLLEKGILGGIDLSNHFNNGMMLCVTEMSTRASIEKLVQELYDISL
jgi:glycine dehydrogenase subunit 1